MSFNLSIVMKASVERGLVESHENFVGECIKHLSAEGVLNCSLEKALSMFDFGEVTLTSKRSASAKKTRVTGAKAVLKKKGLAKKKLIAKLVSEASEEILGSPIVADESDESDGNESDSSVGSTKSKADLKAEKKALAATAKLAKAEAKKLEKIAKAEEKEALKAKKAEEKELEKAKKAEEKELEKSKKAEAKELEKSKKAEAKEGEKAKKAEAKKAEKLALKTKIAVKNAEPELEAVVVDDDEEEEVELPTIEVDGVSFLYDEDGSYSGVNHLLLTEEGTPVGTYDKETNKVTIQEFEEE